MPPAYERKAKGSSATNKPKREEFNDNVEIEIAERDENSTDNQPRNKRGKKRSFETPTTAVVDLYDSMEEDLEEQDEDSNVGGEVEMQNLLTTFGADIRKNIASKRKNVQIFTTGALKTTDKKVGEIWKKQKVDRSKLVEEYSKSVKSVINQWENDVQKMKETEEKYENMFQQMHKAIQQQRVIQNQRIKTVVQLTEQLKKNFEELENIHFEEQGNVQGLLKKEMCQLQKKILKETQQQELSNVRKSLQTMLAQV